MLPFLRRKKHDREDIVFERWETSFSKVRRITTFLFPRRREKLFRFTEESTDRYSGEVEDGKVVLTLKKTNIFGWIINPWFRYRDFVLEAELAIDPENGDSSCGFIVKYANEFNYYYFLISKRNHFRFDVVFNGNPMTLIPWTPLILEQDMEFQVRIIVRGSRFSFFINHEWVGEVADETIDAGKLCFAAQNYNEKDQARFTLKRMAFDSRPIQVETQYYRWNNYIPVPPQNRITLATSLYNQGQYAPAIIQLKRAAEQIELSEQELLMLGDSLLHGELYREALESFNKVLTIHPNNRQAIIGRAESLYLLNRFIELKEFLSTKIHFCDDSSILWNLLGNVHYSLGNWKNAGEAYERAVERDSSMPLYRINAARSYERSGNTSKARDYYLDATRMLFREEAYDDLTGLIPKIEELDAGNAEVKALAAKMLFHEGSLEKAEKLFTTLVEEDYEDSTIYFLLGLLKARSELYEEALALLRRAIDMRSDVALYWYRYAETLFHAGEDPIEPMKRAIELDPDDVWINNLYGTYLLETGSAEDALLYLEKAVDASEDDELILLNYAEALFRAGKRKKAYALLQNHEPSAGIHNQLGNFFSKESRYEEAIEHYEAALRHEADNPVFMENCAAANLECDQVNRAEELLVKSLQISDSPSVYNLLGNVAVVRGEHRRAEAAYLECLQREPDHTECRINLAELYLLLGEYEKTAELIEEIKQECGDLPRLARVEAQWKDIAELHLHCCVCGREWLVPRFIEDQPPVQLHGEPPGEAPAGVCPSCGKVYCVECAKHHLRDNRFVCRDCHDYLKLKDNHIRYLILTYVESRYSG